MVKSWLIQFNFGRLGVFHWTKLTQPSRVLKRGKIIEKGFLWSFLFNLNRPPFQHWKKITKNHQNSGNTKLWVLTFCYLLLQVNNVWIGLHVNQVIGYPKLDFQTRIQHWNQLSSPICNCKFVHHPYYNRTQLTQSFYKQKEELPVW